MNNTIFTRKLGLSILIALVFAFGVQTVADAQLRISSTRGDLQVKPLVTNQSFEFSFYISGVPGSRPDVAVGDADEDREEITITTTNGTINEVRMGSTPYTNADTDFTLEEWHPNSTNGTATNTDDDDLLAGEGDLTTGTVTVTVAPTNLGSFTVTVATAGDSVGDFDDLTFTAYVVRPPTDVQNLRFAATTNDGTVNPITKTTYPSFDPNDPIYDEEVIVTLIDVSAPTAGNRSWVLVDFEVVEGPGFVYDDLNNDSEPDTLADRSSKTTRTLTRLGTDNDMAKVRLRTNGGTNKVRATITNTQPPQTYEITYLYQGTGTTTPPGGGNSLSVSLSPSMAVPGDQVTATVDAGNGNSGVRITLTTAGGLTTLITPKNTGPNGETSFTFRIPSDTASNSYTVTAAANGYTSGTATLTVSSTTVTPRLSTYSIRGTPREVIDVDVTLSGAPDRTEVAIEGPFHSSNRVTARTTSGVARFRLRLPDTVSSGTATVSAPSYTTRTAQLSYTVTGTVPTTGTQVRLIVPSGSSNRLSGATGTNVTLLVQVVNTSNVGVPNVDVAFRNSSGQNLSTVQTRGNGQIDVSYRVGSNTETVTAVITDTDFDLSIATPIRFTITPSGQQPSTLSIIQTNNAGITTTNGAPGTPHTIRILLPQRTANQRVILDVVRNSDSTNVGTYVLFTDIGGIATTPSTFRLPTTPGQYTLTATAGVNTGTATLTVIDIRLVKDTSDSVSGDNQEGDRGEVLDDPFLLKVVQDIANVETPVQGAEVTFTVVDGDGELSTSSTATSGSSSITVNSDTDGNVRAYLVLGEDDEDNRVRANVGTVEEFFNATGNLVPDSIEIVSGNNQHIAPNRYTDPMVVRVTDEDGNDLEGVDVSFSLRGPSGTLTPRIATTDRNGEAEAELLPRSAGTYFVDARVTGVTSVRFTITVGDLADSIEIVSGNNQSGDPGTELDDPLVVEVLDDDSDPVSGVTVTFSVTAGGGSLSDTSVTTNSRGRAQTELTLGDDPGRNTVRASVSGVSDRVTFTATAEDPAPPEPDIRLPASQRADTYWINTDNGTMHRLVGNSVEEVAPNVEDVVSLVVTDNRLYWVEKTGNTSGRIRRANLNGGNIQLIRSLSTAPAGLTIDTVNGKLYVTTERGKIQSINEDGSDYDANLITGLDTPTDIEVDAGSGKLFWITESGTVHYANVDGSGETRLARGYDTLHGVAVGGGKVYWTEETGDDAGKIHSADIDGSNIEELRETGGVPYGITFDASDNKVYWTDSNGRIIQANKNASKIRAVVKDLVSLGDISVPAGSTPTRPPGTFSRYDVNKDGVVDNVDAALVADALGETNPSNPRLDVNGDGNVNFLDLLLVFNNRDESNAAPIAVAKLPKVSPEEVQKQIDLLIASNNDSLTAQHTLAYLQSLLEVVSPESTRLLANYPNPFNPETWIPYQLAKSSDVQITIFNTTGNVVRTLKLGHQSEGYYTDRSRAAYWDGRNAIGEQVASGVYFYVFTANEYSATRKMLILK